MDDFALNPFTEIVCKRVLYISPATVGAFQYPSFCTYGVASVRIVYMNDHPHDPLYGKTLQSIVEYLVEEYGWEDLGANIRIKCFIHDPSISSSLKFLRKTPWAREKVEELYLATVRRHPRP